MKYLRYLAAVLTAAVLIPALFGTGVSAAGTLEVNLSAAADPVKAGDTVAVNVNFGNFPNLTRFGPIEVQFDPSYVSFSGSDRGGSMPSTFAINYTPTTSVITIAGVDQTVESQLAANQTAPTADEAGNPIAPPADPSMHSDSPVTICTLYFKVIDTAPTGDARFWLGNLGGFTDNTGAQVTATAGNTAAVPVTSLLSSDASLGSLSIDNVVLSPAFSPTVFNYTASVDRSVSSVSVKAAPANAKSQTTITGNDNLLVGENTISVKVTAEDGKTAVEYVIKITRSENFVPDGATITDAEGKVYAFAELPQSLTLPEGFEQESRMLGTQTVPVFAGQGIKSLLLYLQDQDLAPALYIYNPDTGAIRPYDAAITLFHPAQMLVITEVGSDVKIPGGFAETTVTIGDIKTIGYVSKDGKTMLIYLTDEAGTSRFYIIDSANGDYIPYVAPAKSADFLIPFVITSVISVAELLMIVYIIYQVRQRNRPKEVRHV